MGILLPSLNCVTVQARNVIDKNNKRHIAYAVNLYSCDNDGCFPESVATWGYKDSFDWREPTTVVSFRIRPGGYKRSMSAYLRSYIQEGSVFYCPNAPRNIPHIQDIWDAGEDWNDPQLENTDADPAYSTYCFYWNYKGCLDNKKFFKGPKKSSGERGRSDLLASCTFAYYPDHWEWSYTFGSCNKLRKSTKSSTTHEYPSHWMKDSSNWKADKKSLTVKLSAAYIDGHVETYQPRDTVPMRVIKDSINNEPYDDFTLSLGIFFLPENALR